MLTIVVPTLNRAVLLRQLLATIPNNVPIFISDNGGSLPAEFANTLAHETIKISATSEVVPLFRNWNRAVMAVESEWFLIPSDDDTYLPGGIDRIKQIIAAHPQADMCIFGHNVIDGEGRKLTQWQPAESKSYEAGQGFVEMKFGVNARFPSIAFKTAVVKELGIFDEAYALAGCDSYLIQKVALNGPVVFCKEIVSNYRVWPDSFTSKALGTELWMSDVVRWMKQLSSDLEKKGYKKSVIRQIGDEIILSNLVAGANDKSRAGKIIAYGYVVKNYGFPIHASLKTLVRVPIVEVKAIIRRITAALNKLNQQANLF